MTLMPSRCCTEARAQQQLRAAMAPKWRRKRAVSAQPVARRRPGRPAGRRGERSDYHRERASGIGNARGQHTALNIALTTVNKTRGYGLSPYAARPWYGSARVRYAALIIIKGQLYEIERSLLPHAGRCLNPFGEAAPRHRGTSARRARQPTRAYRNVACTGGSA